MSLIQSLFARFARSRPEAPDAFALRLGRLHQRELRGQSRQALFRA